MLFLTTPSSHAQASTTPPLNNITANNQRQSIAQPRILSATGQKIFLEIDVPSPIMTPANAVNLKGEYFTLTIPGYAQHAVPGEPQIPLLGFTLAVPPNSNPRIEVIDQQLENHRVPLLLPAPGFAAMDSSAESFDEPGRLRKLEYVAGPSYHQPQFKPEEHLSLGKTGIYRGQTLQTVQFYPVSYNPLTGQAAVCRKITFAVSFNSNSASPPMAAQSRFEETDLLLQSIVLNSDNSFADASVNLLQAASPSDYFLTGSDDWFKIYIKESGIYRLETTDLENAGINVRSIDPRRIRVFQEGVEIPLRVIGEEDGLWNDSDAVEFHAVALKNYFTNQNVYWLTADAGPGLRMAEIKGTPSAEFPLLDIGSTLERREEDKIYRADFPGHTDNERWFMDELRAPRTVTYSLALDHVINNPQHLCRVKFRLQAFASNINISPDHHIQIMLNGQTIYDAFWEGRISLADSISFASNLLIDGENQLQFVGPGDTGSYLDWILIDSYELSYWRRNHAVDGIVKFSVEANGTHQIQLTGFNASADIYDVSSSHDVRRIVNAVRTGEQILFNMSLQGNHDFIALGDEQKLKPLAFFRDQPSQLRQSKQQCDYLFITIPEFQDALAPLVEWHQGRGLSAETVRLQDIYDEFSFGRPSDRAIKSFLTYSYWNRSKPAPRYVLLVGDASWNPRRLNPDSPVYGSGQVTDIVPTRFFESSVNYFEACSDNWFACVDGEQDVLPDMLVGRLPARSAAEVSQMVEKILDYHRAAGEAAPMRRAAFVADIGEGSTLAFEDSSDALIRRYIPEGITAEKIYLSQLGETTTKTRIKQIFSDGALTMNYFGHGSRGTWSAKTILSGSDAALLAPNDNVPFLFTMSCINGYFADPNAHNSALAEMMINQEGKGAIGAFSGSGEAFPSALFPMAWTLYESLYKYNNTAIGSFCTAGLFSLYAFFPFFEDHVRFYILFGDPACPLRYNAADSNRYAGYTGTVRIASGLPAKGTAVQALIRNQVIAETVISTGDGGFGPFFIGADDPATPNKEGGAQGDTVSFQLAVGDVMTRLYPQAMWLPGEVQHLKLTDLPTSVAEPPTVEFYVNGRRVGDGIADGDPLPHSASIQVVITPANGAMLPEHPALSLNGERLDASSFTAQAEGRALRLCFSPANLKDGDYELGIEPAPQALEGSWGSFRFRVISRLTLSHVVNFPNPCVEQTAFTYLLENDRTAQVTIKIYTVSGRVIAVIHGASGDVGYNEIPWDVRDDDGDSPANGVYFYKITADDGEEKVEIVERLVVMQ